MENNFLKHFQIKKNDIISVVGSGGKSTLINKLASQALKKNFTPIISTTTHIHIPFYHKKENLVFIDEREFRKHNINIFMNFLPLVLVSEIKSSTKAKGFSKEFFETIKIKDLLLIEADGSKKKDFKIPAYWEPVIPKNTTLTIIVAGLSIIEKEITKENVHRIELFPKKQKGKILTPKFFAEVITNKKNYFSKIPSTSRVIIYLSKCTDERRYQNALTISQEIEKKKRVEVFSGNIEKGKSWLKKI